MRSYFNAWYLAVNDRLRSLGFTQLKEDDDYGLSLALASIDVTILEMINRYRQFAIKNPTCSVLTREAILEYHCIPRTLSMHIRKRQHSLSSSEVPRSVRDL